MNGLKYQYMLYFISTVIVATLCIQGYWNYKNYQTGKQQLVNDVQTSLDNAVDQYFTKLATNSPFLIRHEGEIGDRIQMSKRIRKFDTIVTFDTLGSHIPGSLTFLQKKDSLDLNITLVDSVGLDATNTAILEFISNSENPVTELSSKIVVSISEDRLRLGVIDSLFAQELARKNLSIDYGLSHEQPQLETEYLRPGVIDRATLETKSQSPYFFYNNHVKAHFTNVTFAILKKNLVGILLSFLLVTAVILCLLYLLKIINHQKQLAEVKNDLISNITHEFKTPIATIGVAMEAIENFNKEMDHEKNLRYAKISREQVGKLNVMVEKLLETATLDSEKLQLNLETKDLVKLLSEVTQKESIALGNKRIEFHSSEEECYCELDVFHFENAINNIIDNAIKYGGDEISVFLQKNHKEVEIRIEDSGTSLKEGQANQLFEKFYRVPRGNTHDVKGFGIGLYYSRKIVEKHNGKISVSIRPNTAFKITLPHG